MVDARNFPLHGIVIRHAEFLEQRGGAYLHAVAEAYRFDPGHGQHSAGQHGHGVGVVQKPGVRADFLHISREIQHHRNRSQRAEYAANAQGIGNGLFQPVFFRNFKIRDGTWIVSSHLDGIDHIICPAKRLPSVFSAEVFLNVCLGTVIAVNSLQHHGGLVQPHCVDIVEGDGTLLQRGRHHTVPQHIFSKYRATGSHKSNLRHNATSFSEMFFIFRHLCRYSFS